jgi:glucose/arabinose dehydrogenase
MHRRAITALLMGWTTWSAATHVQAGQPPLTSELVTNVSNAVYLTHAPGDFDRIFIVQLNGSIRIVKDGALLTTPFLDISSQVSIGGERGMLGLTFHPNYATNGYFFVRYNNIAGHVIARYTASTSNPDVANASSVQTVLTIPKSSANHNGGWIDFGPDGYLYISVGDDDDFANAQDITSNLHGKILRIDVNGDDFPADNNRNYTIPATNPFAGVIGDDEIWAYGLRNPWRCGFDRETGDLWIGDVGELSYEEVNFQAAGAPGGANYGWDCREGAHCVPSQYCSCTDPTLIDPIFEYDHGSGCAIIGGRVYRGCAIPELQGTYFVGDYCSGNIWSFKSDGKVVNELQLRHSELEPPGNPSIDWIVAYGEDAYGELYVCDLDGEVYKIVPAKPADDQDGDGVPDSCENQNVADISGNGIVDVDDLLMVINAWGPCDAPPTPCNEDCAPAGGNGAVDVDDLLMVINNWS